MVFAVFEWSKPIIKIIEFLKIYFADETTIFLSHPGSDVFHEGLVNDFVRQKVKRFDNIKFIGVSIDSRLSFKNHISYLQKQVSMAMEMEKPSIS